jgi:hypothetical protein
VTLFTHQEPEPYRIESWPRMFGVVSHPPILLRPWVAFHGGEVVESDCPAFMADLVPMRWPAYLPVETDSEDFQQPEQEFHISLSSVARSYFKMQEMATV